jgi:hypothetical protein
VADPTVADPTVADPTVADPTMVDPTVVDPTTQAIQDRSPWRLAIGRTTLAAQATMWAARITSGGPGTGHGVMASGFGFTATTW